MTLSPHHLRTAVIEPCLRSMADATGQTFLASPESVAMMLATAEIESGCGTAIAQYRLGTAPLEPNYKGGPAFGLFMVEVFASATAADILRRRVLRNVAMAALWTDFTGAAVSHLLSMPGFRGEAALSRILMTNHHACCMLARLRYLDYRGPMPSLDSPLTLWGIAAAETWANGYWRGADRAAGAAKFRAKLAKAADVLAEIEAVRREATG